MTPTSLAETLAVQLNYTNWVVGKALEGITQEQSLAAPPVGGNCMNWVLGHLTASRNGMLKIMGRETVLDDAVSDRFRRGSTPVTGPDDAADTRELLAAFNRAQTGLLEGLPALSPEQLATPAPFSPGNDPEETVGSLLAGLLFHEAYHAGQLGVLRRTLGCEAIIR